MRKEENYYAWPFHAHHISVISHISKALFHPIISLKGGRSASIPGFPFLGLSSHLLGLQIGEATDKSDLLPLVIEPLSVSWTHGLTKDILQAHLELGVTM